MSITLKTLAKNLRNLKNNIPIAVSEYKQRIAENVLVQVSFDTPVDTSRALSNWIVSIGYFNIPSYPQLYRNSEGTLVASYNGIPAWFYGKFGSTKISSYMTTIAVGNATISLVKPGQQIYIFNTVDYIESLNAGSSPQAPPGYIEMAIAEAFIMTPNPNLLKPSMFR